MTANEFARFEYSFFPFETTAFGYKDTCLNGFSQCHATAGIAEVAQQSSGEEPIQRADDTHRSSPNCHLCHGHSQGLKASKNVYLQKAQ